MSDDTYERDWFETLSDPTALIIVGASDDVTRPGGRVLQALKRFEFALPIYPVNPRRSAVQGLSAYPSPEACPPGADVAVVLVSTDDVLAACRSCVDAGVRTIVVGSAGFAEAGPAGAALQDQLRALVSETKVRILGPNTNGIVVTASRLTACFSPVLQGAGFSLKDGPVTVASQSGAVGAMLLSLGRDVGLPIGVMANVGNEMDLGLAEVIQRVGRESRGADVVLVYIEGLRSPTEFLAAADDVARRGGCVVVLKVGRSAAGARAAQSHTAAIAGEDEAYDGILDATRVIRAHGVRHLVDVGRVVEAIGGRDLGRRGTIASLSGGLAIMLTDLCEQHGLAVPPWSLAQRDRLTGILPPFLGRTNPIDLAGRPFYDMSLLERFLRIADDNDDTDWTMVALTSFETNQNEIVATFGRVAPTLTKPVFVVWVGAASDTHRQLSSHGIPSFPDPDDAVAAVASVAHRLAAGAGYLPIAVAPEATTKAEQVIATRRAAGGVQLDEVEAKSLLDAFGVPVVPEGRHRSATSAADAADRLGYPVVLKLRHPDLVHKTEANAIRLGLDSRHALTSAAAELFATAASMGLDSADLLLQPQIPQGVELLLGLKNDATFGTMITVGLGGMLAETMRDTISYLPDRVPDDMDRILGRLSHSVLVDGYRTLPRVDRSRLRSILSAFCAMALAVGNEIEELDVNPIIIFGDGTEACAVDAFVRLRAR